MSNTIQRQRIIFSLLKGMHLRYFFLYFFAAISAVLDMISVGLILPLIMAITQKDVPAQLPSFVKQFVSFLGDLSLLHLAGIFLIVFLAKNLFKLFAMYGNSRIVEEIRGVWMKTLFSKYVQQHYLFFVSAKHGVLMFNMFDLCQRVMYGLRQLVGLFLHGFGLILTLFLLASMSWQLTVISILMLSVGYFAVHRPMLARSSALGEEVLASYHEVNGLASEVLRGIREVKAYGASVSLARKYGSIVNRMVRGSVNIALLEVVPTVVPEVLLAFLFFVAIAFLEQTYSTDGIDTLLPLLATFSYGLYRVFVQGSTVARTSVAFTSHWPSIDRLAGELSDQKHRDTKEGVLAKVELSEELVCEDVSFSYIDSLVLERVSMKFKRGAITAIVGDSGAGKSTLSDLLIRLLTPGSGVIRYGSQDISDYTHLAWRNSVALVSQDVFLFHGTIKENLLLGVSGDVSDSQIHEALRLAGADIFVSDLSEGLNTLVGERGFKLSGGQRQRIAIARALVRRPRILLLDEATSALDVQTESALIATLQKLKDQLIVVAITHRLSVAKNADFVYVLRGGKVIESGTHSELTRLGAEYKKLYKYAESPDS